MASNYTSGACILEFGTPEARDRFLKIAEMLRRVNRGESDWDPGQEDEDPDRKALMLVYRADYDPDDAFPMAKTVEAYEATALYVYDGDSFNPEAIAGAAQHILAAEGLPGPLGIEWAATCSKGRPDEFGGGACVIWPDRIEWLNTGDWLADKLKAGSEETVSEVSS